MTRDFLQDVNIAGAMLVARCGDILHHSIPNLLKWCNWVLIMLDNEDEYTTNIVNEYKAKYPDRIRIAHTGFPRATPEQENEPRGLFHRFKPLQGPIRETVFKYFRDCEDAGEKVGMIIWPDSDEIFSDSMPDLLTDFWGKADKRAVTMKPVDVFGDMNTIHNRSMTGHTRVFKYFRELTAIPYRTACCHRPLTKQDRMGDVRRLIHLSSLTPEKRDWRVKHWKPHLGMSEALWKLPKPIYQMSPVEIHDTLHREPDLTVEEYLRGGDKRMPVGIENASQALQEAVELLTKMGIRHTIAFGTCLGIVRDGGLVKWDWDVDLLVYGEDLHKFDYKMVYAAGFGDLKVKRDLPRAKYQDGTVSEELYIRTMSFKKHGVRVDCDPVYLSEDGKYRIILKGRKREKFCAKHPMEWFDTTNTVEYRGNVYQIPSSVEDYLASNYGPNWRTPVYGPTPWHRRPCTSQTYDCQHVQAPDFSK